MTTKKIMKIFIAAILLFGVSPSVFAAPGGVASGLSMWVKADSGVDCITEGCQPNSWQDIVSGTSFAREGDTPYLELKANNFNPAVNFGTQSHYKAAFDPISSSSKTFSFFSVGKRNSLSGQTWQCFFNASANYQWTGGGFGLCTADSANSNMGFWVNNYSYYFTATKEPNNVMTPSILSGVYDGNKADPNLNYYVNHYFYPNESSASTSYTGAVGDNGDTYLGSGSSLSYSFNGNMSETIIFSRVLNDQERLKIDSYLSIKYGINLVDVTSYVNSSGDTVFDVNANNPYTNSIAGIAYDSNGELDQRVSGSTKEDGVVVISTNDNFASANTDTSRPQLQDGQYLVWGHNNAGSTWETDNIHGGYRISARKWKVQNTGGVTGTWVQFNTNNPNFSLPPLISTTDNYFIVVDTDKDGDFADEELQVLAKNGDFAYGQIDMPNGTVFALVSRAMTLLEAIGKDADGLIEDVHPTAEELNSLNNVSGARVDKEQCYQDYIDNNPNAFSATATEAEVQTMVDHCSTPTTQPAAPTTEPAAPAKVGEKLIVQPGECGSDYANGTVEFTTDPSGNIAPEPKTAQLDGEGKYPQIELNTAGSMVLFDLVITCKNQAGNPGPTNKSGKYTPDHDAPTLAIDDPLMDDNLFNDSEKASVTISGTTDAEDGQEVTLDIGGISTTATVSGGVWSKVVDLSSLSDGDITITADVEDAAGNAATQATHTITKDTQAPSTPSPEPTTNPDGNSTVGQKITVEAGSCGSDYADGTVEFTTNPADNINPHPTVVSLDANGDYVETELNTANASGVFKLVTTCKDQAGNPGPSNEKGDYTADHKKPEPPVITTPTNGKPIGGTGEPGGHVVITAQPSGAQCEADVADDGTWSCTLEPGLGEDDNITGTVTDDANNTSEPTTVGPGGIDIIKPEPPVITTPTNGKPIGGTGEPGGHVVVTAQPSGAQCEADVADDGTWSCTLEPGLGEDDNLTGTVTDDANNTSDPITVTGGIDITKPSNPTVTTSIGTGGRLVVTGVTEPGVYVTVKFPDGTIKTVKADEKGNYTATSDKPQASGNVTVYATDAAGNSSDEVDEFYNHWYREEDSNGTSYIYEKEDTNGTIDPSTQVNIDDKLEIIREENEEKGDIRLYVQTPSPMAASGLSAEGAPEGCDLESYSAFAKLYENDGSVVTGFTFNDPACADVSDVTLYDGKPLKFVPGTFVKMEKENRNKGGMVIIIDANLNEATTFGEK
jgi:hypothetical protein